MKKIKFMAEYNCSPLWYMNSEEIGDIHPASLPISLDLQREIIRWAQHYDTTLHHEYPPDSGFVSQREESEFVLKGKQLAKRLQEELGTDYLVVVNDPIC